MVKNHLLDHIKDSLRDDSDNGEFEYSDPSKTKTKADNIMDMFDQNGKPLFSDTDTESEAEDQQCQKEEEKSTKQQCPNEGRSAHSCI